MRNLSKSIRQRHDWPGEESTPLSSTSEPVRCRRCGLLRTAVESTQLRTHAPVRRWWWRFGEGAVESLPRTPGPCQAAAARKSLSQIIEAAHG
ncbi:hypothetical protein [Hyalangium sp.]|uniref:hypothetical protein n=1 Tax=Hyalangium sp. TaxID=2028555 RepID=UPI002D5E8339|nr:hypothetical protein [Hyalangium sp.]HYH96903.1 hypothetical protein [Hyalangium sp.]